MTEAVPPAAKLRRGPRKAAFTQVDVKRALAGAIAAGVQVGEIVIEADRVRVLFSTGPVVESAADDVERRMREAFGE